ncbi:MAG: aminopeptidase P family protein [Lachnospiraceae bacterium]|nr:aminopeptidase P family protein [Lachnospiraceae bacterium]
MVKHRSTIRERLAGLRRLMAEYGIDAYLIVSSDFHASEYVGDYFKCREYISGFDGSAGSLVVTATEAGLWTDGRYFIQAEKQLQDTGITLWKMGEPEVPKLLDYLADLLQPGQCLGYDGRTISITYGMQIRKCLESKHIVYQERRDLVGELWQDRPPLSAEPVWLLEERYCGKSCADKLQDLRQQMREKDVDIHLLASLDDIAWLYNFRGNDVAYNPVALAYSLITQTEAVLYIAQEALDEQTVSVFAQDGIFVKPYLQIYDDLESLPSGDKILLDGSCVNTVLKSCIPKDVAIVYQPNPTRLAKALKNQVEMQNERQAHIQDGVAVTRLIYWLKQHQGSEELLRGKITELSVAQRLERYRKEWDDYLGQSFAPIIAAGEHGAVVHYEPTEQTNVPLKMNTLVLMDTGGHYLQGTTDITRTIAMGEISREQKELYTAVLCGNLRLGNAYFQYGYSGTHLDYLAREPLWRLGLNFNHGTGHGVGYLLNVHEGPQGIRHKENGNHIGTALQEGMITSNEPGVYLEGKYGIRLENLMLCLRDRQTAAGEFMRFETLTMVPFDRDAILTEYMREDDLRLCNAYHAVVYDTLSPYLNMAEREWLAEVTAPLK